MYNPVIGGPLTLTHVTASATGGSTFSYGVRVDGGTTTIRDSILSGDDASIRQNSVAVNIVNTQLNNGVLGTVTCVNAYDASFAVLNASCQ